MALRNLRKTGERWLGTPYNGILAAQILADTATGDDGPGALYNEAQDAQYAGKRLRLRMLNWPATGTLRVEENGAYDANGLPAGTNVFSYAFYVDGVLQSGTANLSITVGTPVPASQTVPGVLLNSQATLLPGAVAVIDPLARFISLVLGNLSGVGQANLTGLKWAWFDQVSPEAFLAPTDSGTLEVTDGTGLLVIPLPNTSLAYGDVGWLIVTDSDGTVQMAHKAFSGPVQVS